MKSVDCEAEVPELSGAGAVVYIGGTIGCLDFPVKAPLFSRTHDAVPSTGAIVLYAAAATEAPGNKFIYPLNSRKYRASFGCDWYCLCLGH